MAALVGPIPQDDEQEPAFIPRGESHDEILSLFFASTVKSS
jgi:hypothetical protein